MSSTVFDDRPCTLGEGPLWHPERNQLFWFDIIGKRLMSQRDGHPLDWQFDEHFSAAGWIDHDTLLLASETGLWRFDIASGAREVIMPLDADKPQTRSNDGRADPFGGFWIGTMGKEDPRQDAGAIYRFYDGVIEPIFFGITIPNAICFSPDGRIAYFADTPTQRIMRQPLDATGWPAGDYEIFVDLTSDGLFPDGAVVDADGYLWNAQWGAGRVARYAPDGRFDRAISVAGQHSSCPAFGGANLDQLFVTTAREAIKAPDAAQGLVYRANAGTRGQTEYRVKA